MKTTHSPNSDSSAEFSQATALGLTILAVFVAGFVRLLLDPVLGDDAPYPTFFAAVVFASRVGGWRSAALATVLGFVIAWFLFVPPRLAVLSNYASQTVGLGLYLLVCVLVAIVGETIQRSAAATRDAHKSLGRQAELARITLASIADAVITVDASGKVTFLNGVAQQLTGWPQHEAEGHLLDEVLRLVDQKTHKPVANIALRATSTGAAISLTQRTFLVARDGTERWVEDSTSPLLDERHRVQGAVVIFRDIRSRQQAEEAERQIAEQLRVILDDIADAFFAVDRNWRFAYLNRPAERLMERSREELLGQAMWDAFPEMIGTEFESAVRQAMDQGTASSVIAPLSDGGRWCQLRVDPSVDGISIYLQDVSAERQCAAEKQRLMNATD